MRTGRKKTEVLFPQKCVDHILYDISYYDLKDLPVSAHGHECIEMAFIVSGNAKHRFNGHITNAYAGSVFIIMPGDIHAFEECDGLAMFNVSCAGSVLDFYGLELTFMRNISHLPVRGPAGKVSQLDPMEQHNARKLLETMYEEFCNPGMETQLKLHSLFALLLVLIARAGERSESSDSSAHWIRRVESFLRENFNERLTLEQLAHISCHSPSQLVRAFRSHYGTTPIDYLIRLRLEYACGLLTGSSLSISEIGYKSGFSDGNYFIKQFKRRYGTSPGKFRLHEQEG